MAFGNLNVGTTATATLTVNNSGSAPLTVTGINYPAGFTGAWSGAVAPGGSQPVTVTFAPTAEATYGGTVTVTSDATGGVNTIGASGTGTTVTTTRVIGLSGVLAFGNVYVGTTSTATLTISNTGNAPLSVTGINYPIGFSGVWNGVVPAGGSQAVTVAFAPAAPMSYGGTITVTSDASGGVNTIAASGAGTSTVTTRAIGLSGVLAFGSVTVGTPATATLTISNTGNAPLVVTGISYPTGFSGAWGGPVPAGGSQPVTVTFTPTTATTYGGSVTVTSDATAGTNTIAISGIGTPPTTTDLTGTWSGTYTIVGVAGGECVGEIYRGPQGILNQPLAFRLTMTQNGSALSAIATDPGLTLSSDYTGAWAPTSPIPLSSSGGSPTGVSFTCSASAERSVQFASGLINLTITGDRSAVGTITANYNVLDSVTQANLATMIVTANFTVAR
jgi:LEA14-like dessication related protein